MRKSSRGNPWHDARGRFCSGPKEIEPIGEYDGGTVYGGYDTQEICEELGIMPEMTDEYGYPYEAGEGYDERSPGGVFPEVEIMLDDDNTGEVFVSLQGEEWSETFYEADGKKLRNLLDKKVIRSEKSPGEYEQQTRERIRVAEQKEVSDKKNKNHLSHYETGEFAPQVKKANRKKESGNKNHYKQQDTGEFAARPSKLSQKDGQVKKLDKEIQSCSEQIERLKQEIREAAFDHPEKLYILRNSLDEVKRIKEEAEQKKQEIVKNQK